MKKLVLAVIVVGSAEAFTGFPTTSGAQDYRAIDRVNAARHVKQVMAFLRWGAESRGGGAIRQRVFARSRRPELFYQTTDDVINKCALLDGEACQISNGFLALGR
jgi:hypothetical protein